MDFNHVVTGHVHGNGAAAKRKMADQLSKNKITALALQEIARMTGKLYVPAAVSGRHVHLCPRDIETLFGAGHTLAHMKDLVQPGQFAAQETVILVGPKGSIEKVRVLGPAREKTQVEVSVTDSYKLGIAPNVRMSGDTDGTPGCTLVTQNGSVELAGGVMIAARHLHISPEQAADFGLADRQVVTLRAPGPRAIQFENVLVRCGKEHFLEMHLDTDEANAAGIGGETFLQIMK